MPVQKPKASTAKPAARPAVAAAKPAPVWPAARTEVVEVSNDARANRSGDLPVRVSAGPAAARGTSAPQRVRVEVLDRAATERARVEGVLVRLARADGVRAAGRAKVTVDYRSFATAYGADWSSRLRLVALPECALTTPERRECAGTPLPSRNDPATKSLAVELSLGEAQTMVAATAGASGPAGDYAATSLNPSATWAVGGNTGAFTWSYPMRTPPALGGPAPQVGLSYSSQSVDGQHAASNNQPSWIGEGFEPSIGGFIERRYQPCARDMDGSANNDKKTGDLCWETDNAVLSLVGHSGELIFNAAENRWHLRGDDGSRIERKTGASNGDNDGEHWVVTTSDGVQYWFGRNRLPGWTSGKPETNSTWTAPIFGNDPGEPCHGTAFIDSDCSQAWRWSLDYVVDPSGNSTSYWYQRETNKYGRNLNPDDDATYDRGGWLDRIDYGTRQVNGVDSVLTTTAPMRVELGVADRCLSDCAIRDEVHWPDTPWDMACSATSCPDKFFPTFWSTKRLSTITTQVRNGTGYSDVERWTLTHTFPDPGDGTRAGLWLDKLSHTGLVGGSASVPDVEFTPVQLPNRVDTIDFAAAMNWMRITKIRNETGGTISVNYSEQDCKAGQTMPTPHTNTRRCYPVIWEPEGYSNPVTDWFHKYVVTTIYENDNTGGVPPQGSPRIAYSYTYYDGIAWHYNDDDGLIDRKHKTWSDYRGYGRVGVTVGDAGEQTYTETRYFRGMYGDKLAPTGGTRTTTVDGINDEDWYAGMTRETKVFNGPGGAEVQREVNTPWESGATATRTINGDTVTARFTRVGTVTRHTALDGGRGERVNKTVTTYDDHGMAVTVDDLGLDGVAGDEQCTKNDYTPRNTDAWIMDRLHRVQSYAVKCADAATPSALAETDVIGETRTRYDNQAFEAAPVKGLATHTDEIAAWNAGAPTFTTVDRNAYDVHGRAVSTWDAMDKATTTAFTPATDGPVTSTLSKNPLLHETTTTLDPAWNLPTSIVDPNGKRTLLRYDPLGRLTAVWGPGRDEATETANNTFSYQIRTDAPSVIATSRLNAAGDYVTSYELYDGLMRERQTQRPSSSGGRLITESFYDTAGRSVLKFDTYHASGAPGGTLLTATDKAFVPRQTRTVYDGAGRTTADIFQPYGAERWRTSTYYAGDRTDLTPPEGGTATSKVTDVRDRIVELRQYHGATPTPGTAASWDATSYSYDRRGHLTKVVDAKGNDWIYRYDIRGRQTEIDDPDKGLTVSTYDNAGRVSTITDAAGQKIAYLYDPLGRKRATYENQVGGPLRAQWIYDTIAKGYLSQSTRFVGSAPYQVKILDYNDSYLPGNTQLIIPASETGLAGTYNYNNTYNLDDTVASTSIPSTNTGLPAEALTYGYDSLGKPTTLHTLYGSQSSSYVADTDYNALGEIDQIELYTGSGGRVFQKYSRELETGRLTGVRTDRDSITPHIVADTRYSYDDIGNITKIVDAAPDPVDDTQCFGYDHLRRLTEAWTPGNGDCTAARSVAALGGPMPYWHSWRFDVLGNRTSEVVHRSTGDATTTYTYPASGATSVRPHAVTATSGASAGAYTYDATGNLTSRPTPSAGTQRLKWDPEGHLETSTDATGETRYIYDADGNRLIRRDPTGRTLYLPGQEIRYTTSTGTTSCTRYYSFAGSMVASRTSAGLTWLSPDHQGTALVAVQAGTQQATVRRQTPYGTPRDGTTPAWPNDKGFVGGTIDNTGLIHLGAREYDPLLGRFVSLDPVMDLLDPQQINGYVYSNNNPVTLSDPSGLKFEEETWAEYHKRVQKHNAQQAKEKKKKYLGFLNNARHRAAQLAAQERIKKQVADMGGDPDMVVIEYEIADACKTKKHKGQCGESGSADIVYIDEDTRTIYVWEVKIAHRPDEAASDVKHYIRKIKAQGKYDAKPGFALTSLVFAAVPGTPETVVVFNGPTEGQVLYRPFRWRTPKPPEPPRTAPEPVRVYKPVQVQEPVIKNPWVVGTIVTVGVVGLAGACVLATAGACGLALGAGAIGGTLAASG
ncbi:RHS repeat-associated core domain-containing protein [Micromonospora sp. S4605]|uniref:RHS repeat-associated core domain-containing protein n=1 Tax=Micromonospora sp. S4605 TaxID=1420897 RepID=UPI001E44E56C|nr:RHS repeat-associated core domain-containing protein [Micromonospora sp. S4605]